MKKIILISFLSFFISSVSYSKIKANYKLVCKIFDYGTFQFEKRLMINCVFGAGEGN